ncbi:MAG: IgGFc-binding protein, partial [Bacteroidota bacterium]
MRMQFTARYKFIQIFLIIISAITLGNVLKIQAQTEYFDTKGTDFWLTFIPNYHNNQFFDSNPFLKYGDSLYIFINADEPTTGTIEYSDYNGRKFSQNFSITDPNQFYTLKLCHLDFELQGYNDTRSLDFRNQSERIAPQSFHVTSQKEVTVYAHSQAKTTSDAFIVLPTDILGMDYFVMSYNSDGSTDNFDPFGGLATSSTPSQFAIVANQDSTAVTIYPTDETEFNGYSIQNILLNRGDVYLVQASIQMSALNTDLTGTKIHSTKPISVFAGHQRATVPLTSSNSPSRDCLIEQMPPIKTWGKNAFLIPYFQPDNITSIGTDIYRILSGYDGTEVKINNVPIGTLNEGEFYEGKLLNPANVVSNKPILVGQFKKTSGYSSATNIGDPFLMIIPPEEQFMTSYRVINTQAYEYFQNYPQAIYKKVYTEQYITVVCPQNGVSTILIDGYPVDYTQFKKIPNSNFSYEHFRVSDGVHTLSSNAVRFGIYVYGYGEANSYGYVGGMSLRPIDFQPPQFAYSDSCFSVKGEVTDTTAADSGIETVESHPDTWDNIDLIIQPYLRKQGSVTFSAKLRNIYRDGGFSIQATDTSGLVNQKFIDVPGFTIGTTQYKEQDSLLLISKRTRYDTYYQIPILLENYGKFPHRVEGIS